MSDLKLWANNVILNWHSRQGFMKMLSLCRLLVATTIGIYYFLYEQDQASWLVNVGWMVYACFAFMITFTIHYYPKYHHFDFLANYVRTVIIDTIVILFFIYISGNPYSELFLLILLPLITTAYFLPRKKAVYISFLVIFCYFIVYGTSIIHLEQRAPLFVDIVIFMARAIFLLGATWVYRIQSNFPHQNERRLASPSRVKKQIKDLLLELKKMVNYDTTSVMLIYREYLQIVACVGFDENEEDIYQLEFPVGDERYPNSKVIKNKVARIEDPDKYPSFKQARYCAAHIRSWMGVPLLSPATGECFGMISIDSRQANAFTSMELKKASWFAAQLSSLLTEAQLGPAALTQSTKRENLLLLLEKWAMLLSRDSIGWEDDIQAARALAKFGKDLFHVEDCSVFFLRQTVDQYNNKERVLHLIASSDIPDKFFNSHEIKVTGKQGDGLTGRAVHHNRIINLGAREIKNSPYRTGFTDHLQYLFSKQSRQIIIAPFRDSKKFPQGAIKLENRLGQSGDTRFTPIEEHIFSVFVAMAGLIFENIRQKQFNKRQMQNIHNLRGIMHPAGIKPIEEILTSVADADGIIPVSKERLIQIRDLIDYSKSVLDAELAISTGKFTLENEGLIPAVQSYIERLGGTLPGFKPICDLIRLECDGTRDELPHRVRIAFFNAARESISNVVRHSQIDQIENGSAIIKFYRDNNTFHLEIEDNGRGFDINTVNTVRRSFGLIDLQYQKETIRQIGYDATLQVDSRVGYGTRIHLAARIKGD